MPCIHPAIGAQLGGKLLWCERVGVEVPPAEGVCCSSRRLVAALLHQLAGDETHQVGTAARKAAKSTFGLRPNNASHQNWSRRRSEPSSTRSSLQQQYDRG